MTILRQLKFTPELLIEAPRRSSATPNGRGTLAIFTVSTYSLDSHSETKEIRVLDITDGSSTLFSNDPADKDPQWLGDEDDVVWLREGKDGNDGETEVWIGCAVGEKSPYLAGIIPSTITDVQNCALNSNSDVVAFAFGAPTTHKGTILNPKKAPKPLHTAREYSSHPVRFWDTWLPQERSSLYYTIFERTQTTSGKKWKLSKSIVNALKGTKLQFPFFPGGFMGEGGSFAMSSTGVLIQAIVPDQNLAQKALFGLYHIPLTTFQEEQPQAAKITTPGYTGSQYGPSFTLDGKTAAFLVNKDRKNDISSPVALCVLHLEGSVNSAGLGTIFNWEDPYTKTRTWDRRPSSLIWSNDSKVLYLVADDLGHHRLFRLPLDIKTLKRVPDRPSFKTTPVPERLEFDGSIASVSTINRVDRDEPRMFVSMTGILESSLYAFIDPEMATIQVISSATKQGKLLGFDAKQLSEITFKGAGSYDVQAWIVRPSYFDPSKKYPLALLIHGGPQSSWADSWSTRWNHAAIAEQGYIVVAPNPTGSTGFGDKFMADIEGDWGGRVYEDIVNCFEYVEKNLDFVDASNAVALGASFGGYMVNWIAGQPLAKKLKAIVSHDGIFSHVSMMASDEVAAYDLDVGGTIWDRPDLWQKSSPSSFTCNWETPMLVIHSDNDFRCPLSEGMAVFNTCRARGIEARFLNFSDENHFVLGRENSLKWHHTVFGWINRFTGVKGGVILEDPCTDFKFDEQ